MEYQGHNPYGFAAEPHVLHNKKYRDPYQELVKIAPQNIMNDRRVVRGNTYAAMVIPVNLQPDPVQWERQAMKELEQKKKIEFLRKRKMEDVYKDEQRKVEDLRQIEEEKMRQPWEEFTDTANTEAQLDPDYYIDRPPPPEFLPNPSGIDKETQIEEGELFDFELEAEPILQVLVGKALELSRIEVLEEYEKEELEKHKKNYELIREAELMEVQRMEAMHLRKTLEDKRRQLQQDTHSRQLKIIQKKLIGRLIAKDTMKNLKWNSIQILKDQGVLRDPRETALYEVFVPEFYNAVFQYHSAKSAHLQLFNKMIKKEMGKKCSEHRAAMDAEAGRKQKNKEEAEKLAFDLAEAKKRRKEERARRRELYRIEALRMNVLESFITPADEIEDITQARFSDIRSYNANKNVYTIGGLFGELVLLFSQILQFVQSNQHTSDFQFTNENLATCLVRIINETVKESATLELDLKNVDKKLLDDITQTPTDEELDSLYNMICGENNLANLGLSFILDRADQFMLSKEIAIQLIKAFIHLCVKKPEPLLSQDEEPDDSEPKKDTASDAGEAEGEGAPEEGEPNPVLNMSEIERTNKIREEQNSELELLQTKIKLNLLSKENEDRKDAAVVIITPISTKQLEQEKEKAKEEAEEDDNRERDKSTPSPLSPTPTTSFRTKKKKVDIAGEDKYKYIAAASKNNEIEVIIFHKVVQKKIRKELLAIIKKEFSFVLNELPCEKILEQIEETYTSLEQNILSKILRKFTYLDKPLPLFEFTTSVPDEE